LSKPEVVIEEFFKYYNQKNLQGINSLTTERNHSSESSWGFDNLELTLINPFLKAKKVVERSAFFSENIHL